MRALLLLVAACSADLSPPQDSPDSGPPPPDLDTIVWVEDGSYRLDWQEDAPAAFESCEELSILATEVEFLGEGCQLRVAHRWRGNCLCTNDWCLCPNVGSLYAEIDGVPLRAVPD